MEGDRVLMAGVTVAAVAAATMFGAYVVWGPSTSRMRPRRGQLAGLSNFGQTCFLNVLLQALAACPQFIAWLQLYNGANSDRKSLISSLLNTLEVINGTHSTLRGDPHSPGAVLHALSALGWVIPQEEHDSHELFHVLLASLEEEATKGPTANKNGCLSDALPKNENAFSAAAGFGVNEQPNRPSSAMLTNDFLNSEYDESTSLMRLVRSEAHTPDTPASVCERENEMFNGDGLEQSILLMKESEAGLMTSPIMGVLNSMERQSRARSAQPQSLEGLSRRVSNSCRSLERLTRGPGRVSIWSDKKPTSVPLPFQGAMGNQIVCNGCNFKSAVRYDKFDSVSLNLPPLQRSGLSLGHLLSEYISSEDVNDVKCESCNEVTNHTKSLTFAKLPACLCIHIVRTIWLPTGQVCKRKDFVHFPESLSMAPYCFVQPHLNSQANTPWGSTMSLFSSSLPMNGFGAGGEAFSNTFGTMFPKNLYRLLAVVVHSGEATSGHFVTYRRGALRNAHRWFYTSDTVVREVTIEEVLSSAAYMLFYDRGPQRQIR